jgi:hypothetical protein
VSEKSLVWIIEEKWDSMGGKWFPLQWMTFLSRKEARTNCRRYRNEGRIVRVRCYVRNEASK